MESKATEVLSSDRTLPSSTRSASRSPGTTFTALVWAKALIMAVAKIASSPTSVERLANSGTARVGRTWESGGAAPKGR